MVALHTMARIVPKQQHPSIAITSYVCYMVFVSDVAYVHNYNYVSCDTRPELSYVLTVPHIILNHVSEVAHFDNLKYVFIWTGHTIPPEESSHSYCITLIGSVGHLIRLSMNTFSQSIPVPCSSL